MLTDRPATVTVPERELVEAFATTEYATDPFPMPDCPEVIVIHVAVVLTVDVQAQSARVVTLTVPVPPAEVNVWRVGETVNVHAADCVIETVLPAAVNVAVREIELVFAVNE